MRSQFISKSFWVSLRQKYLIEIYSPVYLRYLGSANFRGLIMCFNPKRNAVMKQNTPTARNEFPKFGLLPPNMLVVVRTNDFVPLKLVTSQFDFTLNCNVLPAGILESIHPYILRKFGVAAVRIHTMKCSDKTPSIGLIISGYVSYK